MDIEIRTITADEYEPFTRAIAAAFSGEVRPDELELERKVAEIDRTLAAYDGAEIVGGAAAVSFRLTVPGAIVDAAGVTTVGVKATHRRRGVSSALMRRQLDDIRAGHEAVAILFASEGGIYGRYGYGLSSLMAGIDIERERTGFVRGYRPSGRVRMLEREAAMKVLPEAYDRVRPEVPGMLDRTEAWWEVVTHDHHEKEERPWFFAAHESDAGEVDAYAVYRVKHDWPGEVPQSTLDVEELVAATPQAYADIWRYCFDVDLMARIKSWNRPVDDPLLHLLAEPRRLRMTIRDGLFARLVHMPRALSERRYASTDRLVFEVHDQFCPWNEGRWELEGGPDGAECRATDGPADLSLSVNELGAAYLGGVRFTELARAGRVLEETPGALQRADAMFVSNVAPWCPHMF